MCEDTSLKNFDADLSEMDYDRKPGVSGMMRVKNDAEFIEACVESCIDALDELIIVYNDCTDDSPKVIERMRQKYNDKIKVYHYTPQIAAWNLTGEEADDIMSAKIDPKNTLAGYYNFTLSKTSYKYAMKIDADQIYDREELGFLCDLYRSDGKGVSLGINDMAYLLITKVLLSISSRFNKYIPLLYKKFLIRGYHKALVKLVKRKKVTLSLSGINCVMTGSNIYVSLGKTVMSGLNIMPPFNGGGDHLIFTVKPGVKYVPLIDHKYNKLNGGRLNVIEQFTGHDSLWLWGEPIWLHLNACRRNLWERTLDNFHKYSDRYLELGEFINLNPLDKVKDVDENILSSTSKKLFCFVASGLDRSSVKSLYKIYDRARNHTSYLS